MRRIMPPPPTRHLAFLIALLLASACGIKGPLYIETPEQKARAEERKQRREAAKQRDSGEGSVATTTQRPAQEPTPAPAAGGTQATPARSQMGAPEESFGPSSPPQ
jgi:predicted small lipoprotein YifL